ncbi:MAG: hypothetical protein M0Z66_12535 [Thermaerobacter sp.]|nr:hypothetical protein [Thermaerobacter sp.]
MSVVRSFSHWLLAESILRENPVEGLVIGNNRQGCWRDPVCT